MLVVIELPDIPERPEATVDIDSEESRLFRVLPDAFRGGRLGGPEPPRGGGLGGSAGCCLGPFETVVAEWFTVGGALF